MSSAEIKAITETCMKELNNQGQGATGSLGDFLEAQKNCGIRYPKLGRIFVVELVADYWKGYL